MTAIDESANVVLYKYKDKKFLIEYHSFPASMDFEKVREYFGITTKATMSNDCHPDVDVYQSKKYYDKTQSYRYAVEVDLFGTADGLVFCDTWIDLMGLFNELRGWMEVSTVSPSINTEIIIMDIKTLLTEKLNSIESIEFNTVNKLSNIKNNLFDVESELIKIKDKIKSF